MSDLVKQLRFVERVASQHQEYERTVAREAAARIEALEAEVERAYAALRKSTQALPHDGEGASMTYYVIVERRTQGGRAHTEYLVALQWDPYNRGDGQRLTSEDSSDAFPFEERAAAEMAAVFVGGKAVAVAEATDARCR